MSFLLASTTAETFTYAAVTTGLGNMLTGGDLSDAAGVAVIQGVVYAASVAFAALTATYGTMTVVGVTAGVGFALGLVTVLASGGKVSAGEGKKEMKLSTAQVAVAGAIALPMVVALAVFGGRVFNNGVGTAGKYVAVAAQPYVQPYFDKGANYAAPYVQPLVNRVQPYVQPGIDFVRAKTGY
jgi:hypothetical protein